MRSTSYNLHGHQSAGNLQLAASNLSPALMHNPTFKNAQNSNNISLRKYEQMRGRNSNSVSDLVNQNNNQMKVGEYMTKAQRQLQQNQVRQAHFQLGGSSHPPATAATQSQISVKPQNQSHDFLKNAYVNRNTNQNGNFSVPNKLAGVQAAQQNFKINNSSSSPNGGKAGMITSAGDAYQTKNLRNYSEQQQVRDMASRLKKSNMFFHKEGSYMTTTAEAYPSDLTTNSKQSYIFSKKEKDAILQNVKGIKPNFELGKDRLAYQTTNQHIQQDINQMHRRSASMSTESTKDIAMQQKFTNFKMSYDQGDNITVEEQATGRNKYYNPELQKKNASQQMLWGNSNSSIQIGHAGIGIDYKSSAKVLQSGGGVVGLKNNNNVKTDKSLSPNNLKKNKHVTNFKLGSHRTQERINHTSNSIEFESPGRSSSPFSSVQQKDFQESREKLRSVNFAIGSGTQSMYGAQSMAHENQLSKSQIPHFDSGAIRKHADWGKRQNVKISEHKNIEYNTEANANFQVDMEKIVAQKKAQLKFGKAIQDFNNKVKFPAGNGFAEHREDTMKTVAMKKDAVVLQAGTPDPVANYQSLMEKTRLNRKHKGVWPFYIGKKTGFQLISSVFL